MSDLLYRTPGPWGGGIGADLTANQVDTNFWILYSLILALQDATPDTISYFTFHESPTDSVAFTFPAQITFVPGDVLTIVAPTNPDPHMTGICFTLVGEVVL